MQRHMDNVERELVEEEVAARKPFTDAGLCGECAAEVGRCEHSQVPQISVILE